MFILEVTDSRLKVYCSDVKGCGDEQLSAMSQILYLSLVNDEEISKKKKLTRYQQSVIRAFYNWFSEYFWIIRSGYKDTVIPMELGDAWLNNHIFK
jgi:hypothetical protein